MSSLEKIIKYMQENKDLFSIYQKVDKGGLEEIRVERLASDDQNKISAIGFETCLKVEEEDE